MNQISVEYPINQGGHKPPFTHDGRPTPARKGVIMSQKLIESGHRPTHTPVKCSLLLYLAFIAAFISCPTLAVAQEDDDVDREVEQLLRPLDDDGKHEEGIHGYQYQPSPGDRAGRQLQGQNEAARRRAQRAVDQFLRSSPPDPNSGQYRQRQYQRRDMDPPQRTRSSSRAQQGNQRSVFRDHPATGVTSADVRVVPIPPRSYGPVDRSLSREFGDRYYAYDVRVQVPPYCLDFLDGVSLTHARYTRGGEFTFQKAWLPTLGRVADCSRAIGESGQFNIQAMTDGVHPSNDAYRAYATQYRMSVAEARQRAPLVMEWFAGARAQGFLARLVTTFKVDPARFKIGPAIMQPICDKGRSTRSCANPEHRGVHVQLFLKQEAVRLVEGRDAKGEKGEPGEDRLLYFNLLAAGFAGQGGVLYCGGFGLTVPVSPWFELILDGCLGGHEDATMNKQAGSAAWMAHALGKFRVWGPFSLAIGGVWNEVGMTDTFQRDGRGFGVAGALSIDDPGDGPQGWAVSAGVHYDVKAFARIVEDQEGPTRHFVNAYFLLSWTF